jgi:hypothetical protein
MKVLRAQLAHSLQDYRCLVANDASSQELAGHKMWPLYSNWYMMYSLIALALIGRPARVSIDWQRHGGQNVGWSARVAPGCCESYVHNTATLIILLALLQPEHDCTDSEATEAFKGRRWCRQQLHNPSGPEHGPWPLRRATWSARQHKQQLGWHALPPPLACFDACGSTQVVVPVPVTYYLCQSDCL